MKKSFMTRVLAVSLSAAMAFSLSSATSLTAPEAATKKLPANAKKATVSLKVGKSTTLKLKSYAKWNITKAASNKKKIATAKLNKKAKATVKVTAKKKGKAVVTLTLTNKKNTKTIAKKVTVKVTKAATTDTTTPTDTTPTDTTPTDTTTDSAVKVTPGALNISTVTATKVDVLTVSFSSVVASTGAVKFTVTKGESTTPIDTKSITWNTDANTATIEMAAKMTKGTYKVSATDGKDTTEGTAEVTDQEVKEIKFLNETALTGKIEGGATNGDDLAAGEIYVYYDVLDQYGDSMRDTVTIKWSPSTGEGSKIGEDRSKGRLTFKKTDKKDFNYSEKFYLTGVYSKTGISASGTFSIGTTQSVDSVRFDGFLKQGTTELVQNLPASFKPNEYLVLYTAFDQNGNELDADEYLNTSETAPQNVKNKGNFTFVSDNVLVVDKVTTHKTETIKGVDYCAGTVVPGMNANSGGTVNLTAISNKSGQKTTLNFVVGAYKILKSFEIGTPTDVVADGEEVELPFTATDAEGNKLTNFIELATQSDFSKLTLTPGTGTLKLVEKDDGSAKLVWKDGQTTGLKWDGDSANGIDRPVSLTAVVVGGETSNQMLYVSDKARPDSIVDVDVSTVLVNKQTQQLGLNNFTFADQYGRNMKKKGEKWADTSAPDGRDASNNSMVYDNGFFAYASRANNTTSTVFGGSTDLAGYRYFVGVQVKGADVKEGYSRFVNNGDAGVIVADTDENDFYPIWASGYSVNAAGSFNGILKSDHRSYTAQLSSTSAPGDVTLKFFIGRIKDGQSETVSKKVSESLKIVKISDLGNYSVDNLDKFFVRTKVTDYDTYELAKTDVDNSKVDENNLLSSDETKYNPYVIYAYADAAGSFNVENPQKVKVYATYNGTKIEVPADYYQISGDKLNTGATKNVVNTVSANAIRWSDLYDVTSPHYSRKDTSDKLTINVMDQDANVGVGTSKRITLNATVAISDAAPYLNTFVAADSMTVNPKFTTLKMNDLVSGYVNKDAKLADAAADHKLIIKDQYGTEVYANDASLDKDYGLKTDGNVTFEYMIRDIVESKDGYVENNFTVNQNSTEKCYVVGAERGDTFTLVITAKCADGTAKKAAGSVTKTVKVTVGADDYSKIEGSDNYYTGTTKGEAELAKIGVNLNDATFYNGADVEGKYGVETLLKKQLNSLYNN